jgi:hypothetical protein
VLAAGAVLNRLGPAKSTCDPSYIRPKIKP